MMEVEGREETETKAIDSGPRVVTKKAFRPLESSEGKDPGGPDGQRPGCVTSAVFRRRRRAEGC